MKKQKIIETPKYVLKGNQSIPEALKKVIEYFQNHGNKNYQVCLVGERESIKSDLKKKMYTGEEFIYLNNKNLNKNYPFFPISIKNSIRKVNKLVSNPENSFNNTNLGIVPTNEIKILNQMGFGRTSWNGIKVYSFFKKDGILLGGALLIDAL